MYVGLRTCMLYFSCKLKSKCSSENSPITWWNFCGYFSHWGLQLRLQLTYMYFSLFRWLCIEFLKKLHLRLYNAFSAYCFNKSVIIKIFIWWYKIIQLLYTYIRNVEHTQNTNKCDKNEDYIKDWFQWTLD